MTYISSQQFRDWDIVDEKIAELEADNVKVVTVPCWYVGEVDGVEYAVVNDKHHTMEAARQLGITVEFEVEDDPEGLTGEELLMVRNFGEDYYNVETSDATENKFDLVF